MTATPIDRVNDELDPTKRLAYLWRGTSAEATLDYVREFLTVADERGNVYKFLPNEQQIRMTKDETGRDLTVKARQTGTSTMKLARRFRRMTNGELHGANCLVAADKDASTTKFREKIERWFNDLKRHGFEFEFKVNNQYETVIAGYENRFIWASGQSSHIARSYSAQEAHLSEFSHWPEENAGSLIGELLPAIPPAPYGNADIESTPAGDSGSFYELAEGAHTINGVLKDPNAEWDVHFYSWWLEIRYRVHYDPTIYADIYMGEPEYNSLRNTFRASQHETVLMNQIRIDIPGVTDSEVVDKILWRRIKKDRQDKTPVPFLQEYPESFETCWLGVAGRYYDTPDGVDHLEYYRQMRRPALFYLEHLEWHGAEITFYGQNLGIWEAPSPGATYVVSGDAAGGGIDKKSDPTCIVVWDANKEKVVARCSLRCSPKHAGLISAAIGMYYNQALVTWERSQHGEAALNELVDQGYPHVYHHMDPGKQYGNEAPRPGIYPTAANREAALGDFKEAISYHKPIIEDQMGTQEMSQFTWERANKRMKAQAAQGQHDDWIMAASWGYWILQHARTRFRRRAAIDVRTASEDQEMVIGANGRVVSRGRPQGGWFYGGRKGMR